MYKLIILAFLVLSGCKTIPQFPIVWFWSHEDLLEQAKEIDISLREVK
jgi:hypothetical protein